MTPHRVFVRLVLRAYPKVFRREFGDEVVRAIADLRHHGELNRRRLLARIAVDLVRSAPRMRLESLMARSRFKPVAIAAALSAGLMAAVVGSPVSVVVIGAAVAVLAILAHTGDRPIVADPGHAARWYRWVGTGAASFAVGFVVLVIDGDELTSPGWAAWMASWATGTVLIVFGLVLAAARVFHRRA